MYFNAGVFVLEGVPIGENNTLVGSLTSGSSEVEVLLLSTKYSRTTGKNATVDDFEFNSTIRDSLICLLTLIDNLNKSHQKI